MFPIHVWLPFKWWSGTSVLSPWWSVIFNTCNKTIREDGEHWQSCIRSYGNECNAQIWRCHLVCLLCSVTGTHKGWLGLKFDFVQRTKKKQIWSYLRSYCLHPKITSRITSLYVSWKSFSEEVKKGSTEEFAFDKESQQSR